MTFDSVLANFTSYVLVISALALGVERIMDIIKRIAKKYLVRGLPPEPGQKEELKEYNKANDSRQRLVRICAVAVGLIVAGVSQIDTFDLLGMHSPILFGCPILGYVLSGLAASRGSAFWHDILGIIKSVKENKDKIARGEVIPKPANH